jgi:hypothetical protein
VSIVYESALFLHSITGSTAPQEHSTINGDLEPLSSSPLPF